VSPAQINETVELISHLSALSQGPALAGVFFVLVGPWVLVLLLSFWEQKRLEAAIHMYEENVRLVKSYEKLATEQKDTLVMIVQTNQRLIDAIEKNQFCPMIRLEKKAKGVQG